MEIRTLRYFLEIAREENMSHAAEKLHVSQPTLSRTMKDLEEELGKPLFTRSNYSIHLTEEGMLLRKRAEDLLEMADKITEEFSSMNDETISGEIYIGCAESHLVKYLARAIGSVHKSYPDIRYRITSGDTEQVTEKLRKGLYDFAFIVEPPDLSQYNYLEIPETDTWGAVVPTSHPLAKKESVTVDDLMPYPIFISAQSYAVDLPRWCSEKAEKLNVLASFNLAYNSSVFSKEGLGITLTFDHLVNTSRENGLVFCPLYPRLENKMYIIWNKYQVFTPAAHILMENLKQL
ncbi:MAG: LysR family transcriptional regulator [Clostridium sp.]|nr:LysR family transcriptional regulator [Clostridium sp.]